MAFLKSTKFLVFNKSLVTGSFRNLSGKIPNITPVPVDMSENPTISNLFNPRKMPLGRWCNQFSSEQCDQERKADLANKDNNLGTLDIIEPKEKILPENSCYDSSSEDFMNASYYS